MRTFPLLTQRVAAGIAFILGISGVALTTTAASATGEPTVTIGTPTGVGVVDGVVTTESAVQVPITLSGFDVASRLDVLITTPVGEGYFSVDAGATSIASNYGYTDSTDVTAYAFNGTLADVTSVLANGLTWVAPMGTSGDITVSVAQSATGLSYNHANGHYYKPVQSSNISWSSAKNAAAASTQYGMTGYLATVTSREENNFITYNVGDDGMWLGGSDAGSSGVWRWKTGPEEGQQFWQGEGNGGTRNGLFAHWSMGEPDNEYHVWGCGFLCLDDEYDDYTVINFNGQNGTWVDLINQPTNVEFNNDHVDWYLIEYGGLEGDTPNQLTATTTETLDVADPIVLGTMEAGSFVEGEVVADWSGTDPVDFAIDLQRFENTASTSLAATIVLPADSGTLTVTNTTGLTLEEGYTSFTGQRAIGFSGLKADVVTALHNLQWAPPNAFGTFDATISVSEKVEGRFYNPDNKHYYEVKTWGTRTSISTANAYANAQTYAGMKGYLVTITSEEENTFIAENTTAQNAWIGATDDNDLVNAVDNEIYEDREGSWHWFTGPEAGQEFWYGESGGSSRNDLFENWASGEPNNTSRNLFDDIGEDFAVTNFNGAVGFWNDALNDATGVNAAIIEYGGMPTEPNTAKAAASTGTFLHAIEPDAPTLSDVEIGDETISATFTDGDSNGDSIFARQYTLDGGTTWVGVTPVAGVFSIDGLNNGETYSLCIRAANIIGYSESSTCVDATPATTPDAPVLSDVRPRENGLRGTVESGAFDGGSAITAWEYQLDSGSWVEFADGDTFDGFVRIESGLTNGQEYTICVRSENSEGTSSSSNCETVTPALAAEPGEPEITAIVADTSTATITVTEPLDGGADLVLFEYSLDEGSTWAEAPEPSFTPLVGFAAGTGSVPPFFSVGVTQTWVIEGLSAGRAYALKVRVTNAAGFTATSDVYRFTTESAGLAMTGASLTLDLVLIGAVLVLAGAALRRRKNEFGFAA